MSLCEPLQETVGTRFRPVAGRPRPLASTTSGAARPAAKRAFDIVAGVILSVLAMPVVVLLALAVCVSLRTCRPFFLQERVGRLGRRFTVPKLRTLPVGTPTSVDKYALSSVRTSRLGSFLRRTHIDELPQLFLVPWGTMSLVGPRPEMPWLLARSDPDFVASRLTVRPGCSGLWQISADAGKLISEVPQYDSYYVENGGVLLDVWILWRTVLAVAGRRIGSCADVPGWLVPGFTGRPVPSSAGARHKHRLEPSRDLFLDAEGGML